MAVPLIIGAIQAGAALAKGIAGARQASKAKKALENFKRQELKNVAERMRVSTLGAELQTQEAQRRFASSVDALRSGGVRGLVGGLQQQEQAQQRAQQQIAADIDRQQMQVENIYAQQRAIDQAKIRDIQEGRDVFEIGKLMAERAAGRDQMSSAIGDLASVATSFVPEAGEARIKDLTPLETSMAGDNFVADKRRSGFLGLFGPKQLQFTEGALVKGAKSTTPLSSLGLAPIQTTGTSASYLTIPPPGQSASGN